MTKRFRWIIVSALLCSVVASGLYGFVVLRTRQSKPHREPASPTLSSAQVTTAPSPSSLPAQYTTDDPSSIWVIVNKTHPMSSGYIPSGLRNVAVKLKTNKIGTDESKLRAEAATQLEALFKSASISNIDLQLVSGFRSYSTQTAYYNSIVRAEGQAQADRVSARPGTSEHQTGWAADISGTGNCQLQTCFASTKEGIWAALHAAEFGFIIRYPDGKESVTTYAYEPWHLRYVGRELATTLYQSKQVMEEYFEGQY